MRHQTPVTVLRSLLLAALTLGVAVACGSGDDSDASPTPTGGTAQSVPGEDASAPPDESAPSDGPGSGTMTMVDGTVYEFEMTSCDTSDTDPAGFPLSNGYDLSGATADGSFRLYFGRAGFDDEFVTEVGSLEGDFDENGQNAGILYSSVDDSLALVVDGADVRGTVTLKAITPGRPHGDEMAASVDVRC